MTAVTACRAGLRAQLLTALGAADVQFVDGPLREDVEPTFLRLAGFANRRILTQATGGMALQGFTLTGEAGVSTGDDDPTSIDTLIDAADLLLGYIIQAVQTDPTLGVSGVTDVTVEQTSDAAPEPAVNGGTFIRFGWAVHVETYGATR